MKARTARVRRNICEAAKCPHLDTIDYTDPCAVCPAGHWGKHTRCEPALPHPLAIAENFAHAIADETAERIKGTPPIEEIEVVRRLAICNECEFFRPSDERCAHPKCGCYLRHKTAWRSQHCPIKKW